MMDSISKPVFFLHFLRNLKSSTFYVVQLPASSQVGSHAALAIFFQLPSDVTWLAVKKDLLPSQVLLEEHAYSILRGAIWWRGKAFSHLLGN